MKDKIIAYGKEYIDNFKQNPLSATAVLTMQIIFVLGWGVFFLYLLWLYSSFVIPGVTNPKGNIYADTLYTILLTAVYPYCCYKFGKMLFSSHTSQKLKLWAIFCSLICAFLLFPAHNGVQLLPFFPFRNVYGLLGTMTELFDFLHNHNMELQKNFVFSVTINQSFHIAT